MKMRFLIGKQLWGMTYYIESDIDKSSLAEDDCAKTSIFWRN